MSAIKLDILAIGAHPDDVELSCGGTLSKLKSEGNKIGILDLTQGEMGTRGTAETRLVEANNAAKILNIDVRENLKIEDCFFENNQANQLKVIDKIRQYQPNIVLCNAPKDRHPDHGRAAKLVLESCFYAGLQKIQTQYSAWRPKHVFHYIQWDELTADFIIGFRQKELDIKIQSCLAYQSQFYDPNSKEPETPISSSNFLNSIKYRAENCGRLIGTFAGEGFIKSQPLGLENFDGLV